MGKTAQYVLGLVEKLLGPAEREKRFEWCLGDKSEIAVRCWPGMTRQILLVIESDRRRGEAGRDLHAVIARCDQRRR